MIKRALIGHLYDLKIGTTHFHIEPKGPFDRCAMTRPCWRNFASEICGLKFGALDLRYESPTLLGLRVLNNAD
jgi:hypothetical protein